MICQLEWLFSSFIYLSNLIVWLPSFSSPWVVQLTSKSHLAIFASVRFLAFFHSVKKVCKPSIFCEILCASKRMLCCAAFFKAKTFAILLFLSFVWFISGMGISSEVIFSGGKFSYRAIFSGANFWGLIFSGESFHGGGGIFKGGSIFIGGNVLGGNFTRDKFPDTKEFVHWQIVTGTLKTWELIERTFIVTILMI